MVFHCRDEPGDPLSKRECEKKVYFQSSLNLLEFTHSFECCFAKRTLFVVRLAVVDMDQHFGRTITLEITAIATMLFTLSRLGLLRSKEFPLT